MLAMLSGLTQPAPDGSRPGLGADYCEEWLQLATAANQLLYYLPWHQGYWAAALCWQLPQW